SRDRNNGDSAGWAVFLGIARRLRHGGRHGSNTMRTAVRGKLALEARTRLLTLEFGHERFLLSPSVLNCNRLGARFRAAGARHVPNSGRRVASWDCSRWMIDECICETRDSLRSSVAPISFIVNSS